jgi:hypothetical protein
MPDILHHDTSKLAPAYAPHADSTAHQASHHAHPAATSHHNDNQSIERAEHPTHSTHAAAEAHHKMAQEVFAAPAKHEMLAARAGQDKQKDHDIETFKHKAATVSSVVMHLVPAAQAAKDSHHPAPAEVKSPADVVVTTDGSLKWQNPKTLSGLADHIRDAHAPGGKVKPLVVAFEQSKPAPGDQEGHLSAKQVERLKQMMTCLADQHTHTEVDKALQEKAHLHVIPTDKQDRVQAPVLIAMEWWQRQPLPSRPERKSGRTSGQCQGPSGQRKQGRG